MVPKKDIFGAEKDKFRAETDELILKKNSVFTLGAENEQKFGAVNGCRNWWTPQRVLRAPIRIYPLKSG